MRILPRCLLVLVLSVLLPLQAQAKKAHANKPVPVAVPIAAAATVDVTEPGPAGIVDDFHELLRQGKRAEVLVLLSEDAIIFETGYAGQTRDDYGKKHVSDDADFAGVTDYHVLRRQVLQDGNTAWVLTQGAVQGIFGDQNVDLEQTETMILRHLAAGWRISHIHWSAHTRPQPEALPPAAAPAATPEPVTPSAVAPSVSGPASPMKDPAAAPPPSSASAPGKAPDQ